VLDIVIAYLVINSVFDLLLHIVCLPCASCLLSCLWIEHLTYHTSSTLQPVFAKKCRSTLLYYLAMFASQDIPAGEELTYSYGSSMTHIVKACQCGAEACIAKTQINA
jgi:hypothetical protein